MKARFTDEQIIAMIKEQEAGDARRTLEEWQENYNWRRPHSALVNLTLMEFLQRKAIDKMAA